jgi:branched-subunit amino acid transport protein
VTALLVLLAIAGGTWALRVAFVTIVDVDALPSLVREALDYLGPAVMAAVVITTIAHGEGHAGLRPSLAEVAGLVAALVVALRTGTLLWALAAAMGVFTAVGVLTSL